MCGKFQRLRNNFKRFFVRNRGIKKIVNGWRNEI